MKRIIVFVHQNFEDLELWYPVLRLREEGCIVDIVGEHAGEVYLGKHGYPAKATKSFLDIDYKSYDGLIVPGGFASDKLRRSENVLEITRYFDNEKKPIGQICHATWVLVSAKILKGRTVTSFSSIKDDIVNAGADWIDERVVVDKNIVSAQTPDDLPVFMKEFIKILKK